MTEVMSDAELAYELLIPEDEDPTREETGRFPYPDPDGAPRYEEAANLISNVEPAKLAYQFAQRAHLLSTSNVIADALIAFARMYREADADRGTALESLGRARDLLDEVGALDKFEALEAKAAEEFEAQAGRTRDDPFRKRSDERRRVASRFRHDRARRPHKLG
jgi:hypothetical protein